MKLRITFILVHIVVIAWVLVFFAYRQYPHEMGSQFLRELDLRLIYEELQSYKEKNGNYPETLDPILHYDEKEHIYLAGRKPLRDIYGPSETILNRIRYRLIEGKPVLTDLGEDIEEGGADWNMDVTYPETDRERFTFFDFTKANIFYEALFWGLFLGTGIAFCQYGIWRKYLTKSSSFEVWRSLLVSLIFLIFSVFFSAFILYLHVYPHH